MVDGSIAGAPAGGGCFVAAALLRLKGTGMIGGLEQFPDTKIQADKGLQASPRFRGDGSGCYSCAAS